MEEILDVERAFKLLKFSIKLMCYCEQGHLNHEKFDTDVLLKFEGENMNLAEKQFLPEEIIKLSQMNVGVCFGNSAIVLEAAFKEADLPRDPESDDEYQSTWRLVYAVRNAFAHNMAFPVWEIHEKNGRRRDVTLTLEERPYVVKLSELHNQSFEYSHIGELPNWFQIKDKSIKLIKKYRADSAAQ
ncbi:MAG: hypothetical protein HZB82_03430 [Deltaproteobacteria bacterium]|nr:hypothetical protein [Deltaproteobacteria bacterium]